MFIFSFVLCLVYLSTVRYYNLMKMGKKIMLYLLMAGMRGDLECMVAIKEIKSAIKVP